MSEPIRCVECGSKLSCPICGEPRSGEMAELRTENEKLWQVLTEIREQLYGQGYEVYGYHLNGNTEPLDNWFEGNEGWLEDEASE